MRKIKRKKRGLVPKELSEYRERVGESFEEFLQELQRGDVIREWHGDGQRI